MKILDLQVLAKQIEREVSDPDVISVTTMFKKGVYKTLAQVQVTEECFVEVVNTLSVHCMEIDCGVFDQYDRVEAIVDDVSWIALFDKGMVPEWLRDLANSFVQPTNIQE